MAGMTRHSLKKCVDANQVTQAIQAAEKNTSGEIRVSLSVFFWGSVEKAAQRAFERMGMHQTAQRNGVLIFVVPSRKRFVVLGDEGIHAKVGQVFWEEIASILSAHFQQKAFTQGLIKSIDRIGQSLGHHFPFQGAQDRNELPDEVDYGAKG